MAYTAEDLQKVRDAIIKLASGERTVSVTFSTTAGSTSVTYGQANLDQLRTLEAQIAVQVNACRRRQMRLYTKGRGFR